MLDTKTLDNLFELFGDEPGWLSRLSHIQGWDNKDREYVEWRDRQQWIVKEKLRAWQKEIEDSGGFDIYNEPDLGKKLVMVNEHIDAIENQAQTFSADNCYVFLGLSDRDKLSGLRHKLRNQIMAQEIPDRRVVVTDADIDKARSVPLESLISNLPRSRKILCPFHAEKTPSFHVYKRGYCYGCGVSIDAIEWQMRVIGESFIQAVKLLCGLGN